MPRTLYALPTAVLALVVATPVRACPFCGSEVGRQVAAGIFDDDIWYHAGATALPMAILLAIVAMIHFGVPRPRRASSTPTDGRDAASRDPLDAPLDPSEP